MVAVLSLMALVVSGMQIISATEARAADARDFNPSNIISDANFYNGGAMTASEVQSFLNTRVPRCIIGDPGYAAGSYRGNNQIASQCLKDFVVPTASKAANAYCAAYAGTHGESAAQIIEKVGRACGISQKVLLVMLEKEQSLISDTWPYVRQFDVAMGYACPDSGPNNSANCDAAYYGFHNQVYRAAWQLKVYRANPASFNYRPFQVNNIQWHPNVGCGASQVYIENWATAALYIYTPYRPNAAALNAQWGTGDACSTYGNRNFFMFYSTWFGSPVGQAYPQIDAKYAQNAWLGAPTSEYVPATTGNGDGALRTYENGAITWSKGSGAAFVLTGDFRDYFNSRGGLAGTLGWPTSDAVTKGAGPGRTQGFQGGAVSNLPPYGFVTISGLVRSHYASAGLAYGGPLGWPIGEQTCTSTSNCSQAFEQGVIKVSGGTARISIPAIEAVSSAEKDTLGAPTGTPTASLANGGGFVQGFANGAITWQPNSSAFVVTGKIRTAFGASGGISGYLGWPIGAQTCAPSGTCSQNFRGGTISVNAQGEPSVMAAKIAAAYTSLLTAGTDLGDSLGDTRTATTRNTTGLVHAFTNGAIAGADGRDAYAIMEPVRGPFNAAGGLAGPLGWPTNNALPTDANGGGLVQGFDGGAVVSSSPGTFILSDTIREKYGMLGGLQGTLGWPLGNATTTTLRGGGSLQAFQNGVLVQQANLTTPVLLDGEIRRVFGEAGGLAGTPGWPLSDARPEPANGGGMVQGFQDAAIASSPAGTFLVSGDIRRQYNVLGGLTGELGWPLSAATVSGTEYQQTFQGGTIFWNRQTGATRVERPQP